MLTEALLTRWMTARMGALWHGSDTMSS
jgi:hypothetical protein